MTLFHKRSLIHLLSYSCFTAVYQRMIFFCFSQCYLRFAELLGVSWICGLEYFINFGKLLAIISSELLLLPHSLSLFLSVLQLYIYSFRKTQSISGSSLRGRQDLPGIWKPNGWLSLKPDFSSHIISHASSGSTWPPKISNFSTLLCGLSLIISPYGELTEALPQKAPLWNSSCLMIAVPTTLSLKIWLL